MTRLASRRWLAQSLGFLLGYMVVAPTVLAQRVPLAMQPAHLAEGLRDGGQLPGSQPIKLTVYLRPDSGRQAALTQYLQALRMPGGAGYHAWLTPAQFAQRFGAAPADVQAVSDFAQADGLTVQSISPSGLRMVLAGTVANAETAFAPSLHRMTIGGQSYFANTAIPAVPVAFKDKVGFVDGLNNVPAATMSRVGVDGVAAAPVADMLASVANVVDANTARVLALTPSVCSADTDASTQEAIRFALEQASAQGITVLASPDCGKDSGASFPAMLANAASIEVAGHLSSPDASLIEIRPEWQSAPGLPDDGLRESPDATVTDLNALSQAVMTILAKQPVPQDGSAARLGNIAPTLYRLIAEPGLYTQPDGRSGVWESGSGLGTLDIEKLIQFFPRGALSVNVSINLSGNGNETHGQAISFTSTVTDTSGQGNGVVPTGTVNFVTGSGINVGSVPLVSGTATASYSQLPGGSYTVQAEYSGDGTYSAANSISTNFSVAAEPAQVTGTSATCSVGGTCNITVTVKSISGVGTPSGTVTVAPQGTSDPNTYSGTLSGSNGTATATIPVAAVQGGSDVFKVNCTTDTSFTCYNPQNVTAQVGLGTPVLVLTANPAAPTNGQTSTLTATVSGHGGVYPTPAGNIAFYDNGVQQGSGTLNNGTASLTTPTLTGSAHSFSATYGGDNNYSTVTASAGSASGPASATTLSLGETPNPPVSGQTTTLTATLGYTTTNGAAPTGAVNFFVDGFLIGTANISNAVASITSTAISGATTHQIYAVYNGDTNYQSSTAPTITTNSSGGSATTTSLIVNPNPPVSGSQTSLVATVVATGGTPTGTVTFYEDNAILGTKTLSAGSATLSSTTLSGTTAHTFYAVYNGNTTYATSTSPTVNTSGNAVGTIGTTTAIQVSPTTPVTGMLTTLSAVVTPASGTGTPTGSIAYYMDGSLLATVPITVSATYYSTTISGNTAHTFYGVYSGDATYVTSTSPNVVTTAFGSGTTASATALTVSPNPPVYGATTTLTAAVTHATGTATPSGTVTFFHDGAPQGTGTLSGGSASFTASNFGSGTEKFVAVYDGDSTYAMSTSNTVTTTASSSTKASTTVSVIASASTVATGGTVTLTAVITPASIVNGANPTGAVTFTSGQGMLCTATVTSNVASCSATLTTSGVQSISSAYAGDTNYLASTSATPATVTVGSATTASGTLSETVSPSANVPYGNTVTLTSILTPTTAVTGGPSGTVTFALSGTTPASYVAPLVSNGSSATATYAIPTPSPGTYLSTATCASTNVTCTALSAVASLSVIKANTITNLVASPTSPLANQTTVFTATVISAASAINAGADAPTGTVSFYINGAKTDVALSNGIAIFSTVLTSMTGNAVTAVYSGDTNWNGSTSSQINVVIAPIPTTGTLTANQTTALYGANVVLKDSVLVSPSTLTPYPNPATGSVTFYDNYNGQTSLIATVGVTALVLGQSVAQTTTTGLLPGTHYITALFNGGTTYASSTSTLVVNITDYNVSFSPPSLTVSPGSAGSTIVTITPVNGFGGQVALACSPPTGAGITCTIAPASITVSGTAVLSIQTTANKADLVRPYPGGRGTVVSLGALSLLTLLAGWFVPRKRRLPMLLLAVLAAVVAGGSVGCTTQGTINTQGIGGTGSSSSGTPLGTQLITVTTQGTDGVTVVRHNANFPITVQ